MSPRRISFSSPSRGGAWLHWWIAASLGVHGLLLVAIAAGRVVGPAVHEVNLRVRLLTEGHETPVPAPSPTRTPPPRVLREAIRRPLVTVQSTPASPPVKSGSVATGMPEDGSGPPPDMGADISGNSSVPGAPAGGRVGGAGSAPPPRPTAEGGAASGSLRSDLAGSSVEPDRASSPASAQSAPQGTFLMPSGNGGTGHAGFGTADGRVGAGAGGVGAGGLGADWLGGAGGAGGGGPGFASRGGSNGAGGGGGVAGLLRDIRRRIEQAKVYPEAARREGLQGTVELRFRIAADGSVEVIEILRSSGYRILDESSQQTIRTAAPYPLVGGWIRLPLSYRLDQ